MIIDLLTSCVKTARRKAVIFLFIIALLSLSKNAVSQSEVKKYAYLVYAKTNNALFTGVGFFVKLKKDLFFVTAKNLVSIPADTLNIIICDTCSAQNQTIKIDISSEFKSDISSFGEMDIYSKKINSALQKKIKSVEGLIHKNYNTIKFNEIESIIMYGYPKSEDAKPPNHDNSIPQKILTKASLIGSYELIRYSATFNRYDSINYWAKAIDNTYANEGDSGAPVFFKIGNKYYFGGMCVSGAHTLNVISIMRPEKIIQFLLQLKK